MQFSLPNNSNPKRREKCVANFRSFSVRLQILLPIPANQKCNDYLKEIAAICGIEKRLTFHLARHTFATTVTLTNGVPIESVSKMLGHRSLKTTQIYAKIINDKLAEDMTNLSNRLQHLAM